MYAIQQEYTILLVKAMQCNVIFRGIQGYYWISTGVRGRKLKYEEAKSCSEK